MTENEVIAEGICLALNGIERGIFDSELDENYIITITK